MKEWPFRREEISTCVYDKPHPEDKWYLNQMIKNTSHCYTP